MSKILVEESALESIKAMAQRLQEERDRLLFALQVIVAAHDLNDLELMHIDYARSLVARCTTTTKVME